MARDVTGPAALDQHADDPQTLLGSDDDGRRYWKARRFADLTAPVRMANPIEPDDLRGHFPEKEPVESEG